MRLIVFCGTSLSPDSKRRSELSTGNPHIARRLLKQWKATYQTAIVTGIKELRSICDGLDAGDVIIVSETHRQVIQVTEALLDRPGYKIFVGLHAPLTGTFNQKMLEPASQAFPVIDVMLATGSVP